MVETISAYYYFSVKKIKYNLKRTSTNGFIINCKKNRIKRKRKTLKYIFAIIFQIVCFQKWELPRSPVRVSNLEFVHENRAIIAQRFSYVSIKNCTKFDIISHWCAKDISRNSWRKSWFLRISLFLIFRYFELLRYFELFR